MDSQVTTRGRDPGRPNVAGEDPARRRIELDRRQLLGAMAATAAGMRILTPLGLLSPARARAQGAPLAVLTVAEGATLEALGDTLLPGAAEAGIANFVDAQLAKELPFLIYRYLDVPIPPADFYRGGLAALDAYAAASRGKVFVDLPDDLRAAVVGEIAKGDPEGWQGPPAGVVYFVVRADAVDVVYGTEAGFERLGLPYIPHIAPPERW